MKAHREALAFAGLSTYLCIDSPFVFAAVEKPGAKTQLHFIPIYETYEARVFAPHKFC